MLATVRRICGRIMHLQPSLRSQWDKGWKNNSQFASPSIRRPTAYLLQMFPFEFQILIQFHTSIRRPTAGKWQIKTDDFRDYLAGKFSRN